MRTDPPVRDDGLCHVCLKPRRPERSKRYGGAAAEMDSFCSTECARAYHENPLPTRSVWEQNYGEVA